MNGINCIYADTRYVVSELVYVSKQSSVHLVVNKLLVARNFKISYYATRRTEPVVNIH